MYDGGRLLDSHNSSGRQSCKHIRYNVLPSGSMGMCDHHPPPEAVTVTQDGRPGNSRQSSVSVVYVCAEQNIFKL